MSDQRGTTMVELLVGISMTLIVLVAVFSLTTAVIHSQDRIVRRVDANSRARPVMTRIIQGLHSACVTSHIVPIQAGSTGTSISFFSKSGSAVGPTPDLHTVYFVNGPPPTLREAVYAPTGGTAPNWTFSPTASSDTPLLANVAAPAGTIFRYYDFINGALSTTPLPTPLSSTNAARVSYVTVGFTSLPSKGVSTLDPRSPLVLNDAVDLRLENAGQYPNQDNLPCV